MFAMLILNTGHHETDHATERAARLLGLSRSPNPQEAEQARHFAETHMQQTGIVVGTLPAYSPASRDIRIGYDKISILVDGVPHWRAHLALVIASFAGFHNDNPWEYDDNIGQHVLQLLGTRETVARAKWLFAGACLRIVTLRSKNDDDDFYATNDFVDRLFGSFRRSARPIKPIPFEGKPVLQHAFFWGAVMAEAKYLRDIKMLIRAREGHDTTDSVDDNEGFDSVITRETARHRFQQNHGRAMVVWQAPDTPVLYEGPPPAHERPTSRSSSREGPQAPFSSLDATPGDERDAEAHRAELPSTTAVLEMFSRFKTDAALSDAYAEGFVSAGQVCAEVMLTPRQTIPG